MNNERIVNELVGYIGGIFAMGALSRGVQLMERRKEKKKEQEEEQKKEDAQGWRVTEHMVKQKDGSMKKVLSLTIMLTDDELEEWIEYSENYQAKQKGYYLARRSNRRDARADERGKVAAMKEPTENKAEKAVIRVVKGFGRVAADTMVEGAKRRIVFELKDSSRNFAKSSKDTEIFIKNNAKNRLVKKNDMF